MYAFTAYSGTLLSKWVQVCVMLSCLRMVVASLWRGVFPSCAGLCFNADTGGVSCPAYADTGLFCVHSSPWARFMIGQKPFILAGLLISSNCIQLIWRGEKGGG